MELIIGVGATVIGGAALAFVLSLINDFVLSLPDLNGLWRFESQTLDTSYNPYRGMKLTYLVLLWQEGHAVYGSGEKVREDVNGAIRTYTGPQRSRIEIRGYLTKRYLSRSEIVLHFCEQAERRQSSTMQTLTIHSSVAMKGEFASTIANSSGATCWARGTDGLSFEGLI